MNTQESYIEPKTKQLVDLLKQVSPPKMEDSDWIRLENKLFADMGAGKQSRLSLRDRPVFLFFFKPVFAAALLLAIGAAVFLSQHRQIPSAQHIALTTRTIQPVITGASYKVIGPEYIVRQIDPGTGFKLYKNAKLTVVESSPTAVRLNLESGSVLVRVSPRAKGQDFIVSTPDAVCRVVGTRFKVEVMNTAPGRHSLTRLIVMEGKVRFSDLNSDKTSFMVVAGEEASLSAGKITVPAPSPLVTSLYMESDGLVSPLDAVPGTERIKALKLFKGLIEQETATNVKAEKPSIESDPLKTAAYQIALDKMEKGENNQALSMFNELLTDNDISSDIKLKILEKKATCFRSLGDFSGCINTLMSIYGAASSPVKRDNLLWEIAGIKASNMGLYRDAAIDLKTYIKTFKEGVWVQEAYIKLAEIEYLLKEPDSAVAAYSIFVQQYPESPLLDKALYNIAYIEGHDLKDCASASKRYYKLESEFPNSPYLQDAIFWHADCLLQLGENVKAMEQYSMYLKLFPQGRWKDAAMERMAKK